MLANNKFDAAKQQIQNFASFPPGSRIIMYGGTARQLQLNSGGTTVNLIEQPQKCHICQKDFSSFLTLQEHIKIEHLEKQQIYRNIIVSTVNGGHQMVIPHQYQLATNATAVKIEKDFQPIQAKVVDDVIKQNHSEFPTVANFNISVQPVIQHIHMVQQQQQSQEKDKSSVAKQNPVEYHIQQQEHAATVLQNLQKSGIASNPFLNSTIKYEIQPVQLVTEVYPQMIAEAPKSDDMNSQSSVSSPGSSINVQTTTTAGPMLSNGETMEKQHKCLVCDKFFTTVGNLNIHLKIHAGEKPYSKFD
jgi:hypothetical protein